MPITRFAGWLLPTIIIALLLLGYYFSISLGNRLGSHEAALDAHHDQLLAISKSWLDELNAAPDSPEKSVDGIALLDLQFGIIADLIPIEQQAEDLHHAMRGNWFLEFIGFVIVVWLAVALARRARRPVGDGTRRVRPAALVLLALIGILLAYGLFTFIELRDALAFHIAGLEAYREKLAALPEQWLAAVPPLTERAAALAAPIQGLGGVIGDVDALRQSIADGWLPGAIASAVLFVIAAWLAFYRPPAGAAPALG